MDEKPGLLPAATRKQFQQALAKCQSCLSLTGYLERLGHPQQETSDRADHLQKVLTAALEMDRQAKEE